MAVDAIARYDDAEGVNAIASCDIYEFTRGSIHTITSRVWEVDSDSPFQVETVSPRG